MPTTSTTFARHLPDGTSLRGTAHAAFAEDGGAEPPIVVGVRVELEDVCTVDDEPAGAVTNGFVHAKPRRSAQNGDGTTSFDVVLGETTARRKAAVHDEGGRVAVPAEPAEEPGKPQDLDRTPPPDMIADDQRAALADRHERVRGSHG